MPKSNNTPSREYHESRYTGGNFSDWLLDELWRAYRMARRGKRKTEDEHKFEVNDVENILKLHQDIVERRYKPSRGIAFLISQPVRREIFAAPFRDRIVHHFLYNVSAKWWDKQFINDSYSCRNNKGALYGQRRLLHFIRQASNNNPKNPVFVAKLDLQGYFMSLSRKKLYRALCEGLDKQFSGKKDKLYKTAKYLWRQVIFDDPTIGVKIRGNPAGWRKLPRSKSLFAQPKGQGIVIGNLTSQLLSNIYLNALDHYITQTLGYKRYGRYVDDFFIVVPLSEKEQLLRDVKVIEKFLKSELNLTLHPKKRVFRTANQGIPFLGVVVYTNYIVPGHRLKSHCQIAFRNYFFNKGDKTSVVSYQGHMMHINSNKFLKELYEKYQINH